MKYYAVRHADGEYYPMIKAGEVWWHGTPHRLFQDKEDAIRNLNYILDVCDDPVLDNELIIVEVER